MYLIQPKGREKPNNTRRNPIKTQITNPTRHRNPIENTQDQSTGGLTSRLVWSQKQTQQLLVSRLIGLSVDWPVAQKTVTQVPDQSTDGPISRLTDTEMHSKSYHEPKQTDTRKHIKPTLKYNARGARARANTWGTRVTPGTPRMLRRNTKTTRITKSKHEFA